MRPNDKMTTQADSYRIVSFILIEMIVFKHLICRNTSNMKG